MAEASLFGSMESVKAFVDRLTEYAHLELSNDNNGPIISAHARIASVEPDLRKFVYLGHDFDGDHKPDGHTIVAVTDSILLRVPLDRDRITTVVGLASLVSLDVKPDMSFTAHFQGIDVDLPLGRWMTDSRRRQTQSLFSTLVGALAKRDSR